jgi:hypothetical protein
VALEERFGAALESRLWLAEGGVRGRELEFEMFLGQSVGVRVTGKRPRYKALKLSMSAWE